MKKFFILFLIISIFHSKSYALIEVDITRGNLDPHSYSCIAITCRYKIG